MFVEVLYTFFKIKNLTKIDVVPNTWSGLSKAWATSNDCVYELSYNTWWFQPYFSIRLIIINCGTLLHDYVSLSITLLFDLLYNNFRIYIQGVIVQRIQASVAAKGNKRFIYLGDGVGDYCPSLKLKERDFVMPRKNFPVWDLISKNPLLIKAKIHEWSNGDDLEKILLGLIDTISIDENALFDTAPDLNKLPTIDVLTMNILCLKSSQFCQ